MVEHMFDSISGRYDLVNRLITFGLDIRWRRSCVSALGLPAGSAVIDLACGTGDFCRVLARRAMRPLGVDFSAGMLAAHNSPAPLVRADALTLPLRDASVDGATCGFALRNFSDLAAVIGELGRVVRPGGRIALLEVSTPRSSLLRLGHSVWFNHCVPVIGSALSDGNAYRYLPRSVAYLPDTRELAGMVRAAGFSGAQRRELAGGVAQIITATRRGIPPSAHANGAGARARAGAGAGAAASFPRP